MTREEEIKQAAKAYCAGSSFRDACIENSGFIMGAKWADSHPVNGWHKVEDELPPKNEFNGNGKYSIGCLITDGTFRYAGYYSFESEMWIAQDNLFSKGSITH